MAYNYLYNILWMERDMKLANFPLMGSPVPLLTICAAYLLFTLKLGPALMRSRPSFPLTKVLLLYNSFQVVANFYIFGSSICLLLSEPIYDYGCMMPLPADHHLYTTEIYYAYSFYMLKVIDLLDTVFFILRGNFRQVTFLHVYHHIIVVLSAYVIFRYTQCGGHICSLGILNALVHGCMYTYYLLSAVSPQMKGSLWWKKYITRLQLAQFVLLIVHNLWPLVMRPDCQYPKFVLVMVLTQSTIMFGLFTDFYIRTYVLKPKKPGNNCVEPTANGTRKTHAH